MPSNNYLSNEQPRLPKRVLLPLREVITRIELQTALIADGQAGETALEKHMGELLRLVDVHDPEKSAHLRTTLAKSLKSARLGRDRFAPFAGRFDSLSNLRSVDIGLRHKAMLSALRTEWAHIPPSVSGAHLHERLPLRFDLLRPQTPSRGLRFYLAKVEAIDETGRRGPGEWGKDDIFCGAAAVDENGETSSGGLFKVGEFNDGDVKDYGYPGKVLQYFNIREGGHTFPKIYTLAVSLIEHDHGDLIAWFDRFIDMVKEKVIEALTAAIGAAVGSALGPLGSLIGAAIGWAVGKVIQLVRRWLGDEEMGTRTLTATINSYSGCWTDNGTLMSNLYTRDYAAHHGHYRIWWRCELVQ